VSAVQSFQFVSDSVRRHFTARISAVSEDTVQGILAFVYTEIELAHRFHEDNTI